MGGIHPESFATRLIPDAWRQASVHNGSALLKTSSSLSRLDGSRQKMPLRQVQMFILYRLIYAMLFSPTPAILATSIKTQHQPFLDVSTVRDTFALNIEATRTDSSMQMCRSSSECILGDFAEVECYGLSSNRSLVSCHESVSPCVCRSTDWDDGLQCDDSSHCPFENACALSVERSNSSCIPCEFFASTSGSYPNCSDIPFDVLPAPPDRPPTIMEACVETADCDRDFQCLTPLQDNIHSQDCWLEDTYSSCVCNPTHYLACNMFKPCPSKETCVSESILSYSPICIDSEAVDKSKFPINRIFTLPHFVFTLLFVIEMSFICIKLVFQGNSRRKLRLVAGGAFVLESLVGITSTVLQATAMFLIAKWFTSLDSSLMNTYFRYLFPSILYVISELVSVTAESRNIKKRIFLSEQITYQEQDREQEQEQEEANDEWPWGSDINKVPKPRFSLSRRVILKWICVISCCINLALGISTFVAEWSNVESKLIDDIGTVITKAAASQYKKRMIVILSAALAYLFVHIVLFLRWRRKKILRIVSALFFALLFGLVTLWAMLHESHFPHLCVESYDMNGVRAVGLAILLLSVHILFVAISAYNISGFQQTLRVSQEQTEFIETALLGTVPHILIIGTSTICRMELTILLMVAYPQVAVLLAPVLVEYIPVIWKTYFRAGAENMEHEPPEDQDRTTQALSVAATENL